MGTEMDDLKALVASMAKLLQKQCESQRDSRLTELSNSTLDAIESRIQEFVYSPEDGATFERWWNRHEDIFEIDLKEWTDVKKVRLLIRHVTTSVERTFTESVAPTKWIDIKLEQVKEKMLTLFGDNTSIFDRRRTMLDLKMSRENIEDVRVLAARVNQTVENAKVSDASINEWKVLTFLHSLDLPRYSDVHLKMMQTAKQKGKDCTLDDLLSVYNDLSQLKKDSRTITESSRQVNYVDRRSRQHKSHKQGKRDSSSSSEGSVRDGHKACYCCGNEEHLSFNCPFRSARCNNCNKKGHLARMCKTKKVNTVTLGDVFTSSYRIQVEINGLSTSMAIDTGSDITIVSDETWKQLGRPDCKRVRCTVKCANGDDLKLRGRFCAKMEYGGVSATSDVYVTHGRLDLLGKNFIKLLQLVKVRGPEAKENTVKVECEAGMTRDHNAPEAKGRVVKASVPEAKEINLVKIECEAESVRDHNGSEASEVDQCEVGSSQDHKQTELEVKDSAPMTNENGIGNEIALQKNKRDSDRVKRDLPEATPNRTSSRNELNGTQLKMKSSPVRENLSERDKNVAENQRDEFNEGLNEIPMRNEKVDDIPGMDTPVKEIEESDEKDCVSTASIRESHD